MNGARSIRIEKSREYQYKEEYAKGLESKRVEWDESRNVEKMWEQVKRAMFDSAREVLGSARMWGERTQSISGGMM